MRLISVRAILDIESDDLNPEEDILKEFGEDEIADRYAILSHCWGKANEEVKLKEMEDLPKLDNEARHRIQQRPGYKKIIETCKQARRDGFEWVWADTCCINKDSSAELSEAINSMYRWYDNAGKCYAYLHDIDEMALPTSPNNRKFRVTNGWPKWFSRGWTLQELIAPKDVLFFNAGWQQLEKGTRTCLAVALSRITGIPVPILRYGLDADRPSTAQIMSWAAKRKTTRVEDRAYSLMGLFGVYMPMLYGEGTNAFRRLQLEIIRSTNDHSIFAWQYGNHNGSVLADDPSCFAGCSNIVRMEVEGYHQLITKDIPEHEIPVDRLRTCSVTNGGIQICLPFRRIGDSNAFRATLACHRNGDPIRISLAHVKSQYHRWNEGRLDGVPGPFEFRELFLAYDGKARQDHAVFKVDDSIVSRRGFVREDIQSLGEASKDNVSVPGNNHAVISYFNETTNTRFAVVLGLLAGQAWAHLTVPQSSRETSASVLWDNMQHIGSKQAQAIANLGKRGKNHCHIKHLHLPRSIADIRLTFQPFPQPNSYSITLDVFRCTGCCVSNDRWQSFDTVFVHEGCMLNDARIIQDEYPNDMFLVDGISTSFVRTLTQEFELGDYGHWEENDKSFEREGNIFTQPTSTASFPDSHLVEHEIRHPLDSYNKVDHMKIGGSKPLILWHPQCLSLSNHGRVTQLLKVLSTRLQGKCLVTTVLRCSKVEARQHAGYKIHIPVSLFIPTRPLLWYRDGACEETRKCFQEIRQQFGVLLNSNDQPMGVQAAVNFLSTLFGGEYLRDYFGDIEIFQWIHTVRFHRIKECQVMKSDNGTQHQSPEMCYNEGLEPVGVKFRHSRIDSLAKRLVQRMPITADDSIDVDLRGQYLRDAHEFARRTLSKAFGPEASFPLCTELEVPVVTP